MNSNVKALAVPYQFHLFGASISIMMLVTVEKWWLSPNCFKLLEQLHMERTTGENAGISC
jgi:hypothetical protein